MPSTLDQFIAQNPDYKAVPQEKLLQALHTKYYADLPFDKFRDEVTSEKPTDIAPPPIEGETNESVQIKPVPISKSIWERAADTTKSYAGAVGRGLETGALEGAADIAHTAAPVQQAYKIEHTPKGIVEKPIDSDDEKAAKWLKSLEPAANPQDTGLQKYAEIGGEIAGGFAPGALEWVMGTPFSVLHGMHTAEDHARTQGREATPGEEAWDALIEGLGRKITGAIAQRGMGRVPTALSFGGVQGAQAIAENHDPKQAAVDGGISLVLGFLGPNISPEARIKLREAKEQNAAGHTDTAMKYVDQVLVKHSDVIAAAARNLGVDAKAEDVFEGENPAVGDEANRQRMATPEDRKTIKNRASDTLVTRITHRERDDAVARARMSGWEEQFKGVPSRERIELIAAYQRRGVDGVPERWRAFFKDFAQIMEDQGQLEHEAGFEYEFRKNYAPGYWQDPEKAAEFYEALPKKHEGLGRKPSFTKGKGFEDYLEGVEAGFKPRVDNPAVLAAMRIEAGNEAIMRRQAMRDIVHDGLAIPLSEETEGLEEQARTLRAKVKAKMLKEMVESGDAREVSDVNADRKQQGLKPIRGNLRVDGVEYDLTPEAFARLNDKVSRVKAARLRPAEHKGWQMVDVVGTRYLVHPLVKDMLERALSYDAQQFTDLLHLDRQHPASKAERTLGKVWTTIRNFSIPIKLSFSAFHALHILGIDIAQPITAVLSQALNRRMTVDEFLKAVSEMPKGAERDAAGRRAGENFSKPDKDLNPLERLEQNLFLAGGFSPRMPSGFEIRAQEEYRRVLNDIIPRLMQEGEATGWSALQKLLKVGPEYGKLVFHTISHLIEHLQGPLFREFIPQLKAASYLNEAKLLLAHQPKLLDGTPESNAALRNALHNIAKSIDNRFGEMQYDKMFWPSLAKRSFFSAFLSVGWNYGFIREFLQGLYVDLPKLALSPKEQRELTTRTVYAATYLSIGTVVAGMMTYLMTGQAPKEPKDFIYPKMPDGSRLNTMFFNREFSAAYYHIAQQGPMTGLSDLVEGKLSPVSQSFWEVLHNQDYFGNQIYDTNAPLWTQVEQMAGHYTSGALEPISIQGIEHGKATSAPTALLSAAGFNPAPKYIEMSPIQARIHRAYASQFPEHITAFGDEQREQDLRAIKQHYVVWLKNPQDKDAESAWRQGLKAYEEKYKSTLRKGVLKRTLKEWRQPDFAGQFRELDRETQAVLLRDMSPDERKTFLPYAHVDVRSEFK